MPVPYSPFRTRVFAVLLVAATFAAYRPAWNGQFLWDDDSWTTLIADLLHDGHGLWRMWTVPAALQQYYPLSGTSFWLDAHLWGDWTLPYHLENIDLHATEALLFWRVLWRLDVPGAALAAAIFALQPVMVESVAWITERKNVLSLALYLTALLCYGRFTGFWQPTTARTAASPPRRVCWYFGALVWFLAALTAKVTAFSLPAVVLLLCWWRRGRIHWRQDVLPTLPFFALSVGFGLAVSSLEKQHLGAMGPDFAFTPVQRCLIAGRVFWFYAAKLLWPAYQSFIYPRWTLDPHSFTQWLYPATALAAVLLPFLLRHRIGRGPAAAVFFYAGTLFPVMGLLNGYFMFYSFVWDHLAYVSSLGIITLAAAGLTRAAERVARSPFFRTARVSQPTVDSPRLVSRSVPLTSHFSLLLSIVLLSLLATLTWRQSTMYRDVVTLYRTTLRQNSACWLACNNLGSALVAQGKTDEAIHLYERAIVLRPAYAEAHNNLANAFAHTGHPQEAVAQYEAALATDPQIAGIHANLAVVLTQMGRPDEGIIQYREAARTGHDRATALVNLADALLQRGDHREAAARLAQALALRPADAGVANDLAFLVATTTDPSLRDGPRALILAERINAQTSGGEPLILRTVAAAQATSNRFPEAIITAQNALELATSRHDNPLADALRTDLELYRLNTPLSTGTEH